MKRAVKFNLSQAANISLLNAYGERLPFTPVVLAAGVSIAQLTPNAETMQRSFYALVAGATTTPFVVPSGEGEIEFEKLTLAPSQNGWRVFEGDERGYAFAPSLIDRIDAHIRDIDSLRGYEGEFFRDFCRAQDGEIEREDLSALDLLFFNLAGGNNPSYQGNTP
jgi:hypothetical protein